MAILRLSNGSDVKVTLSIGDALGRLNAGLDFVELPTDEGMLHVRPAHVIAVLDDSERRASGFRFSQG